MKARLKRLLEELPATIIFGWMAVCALAMIAYGLVLIGMFVGPFVPGLWNGFLREVWFVLRG